MDAKLHSILITDRRFSDFSYRYRLCCQKNQLLLQRQTRGKVGRKSLVTDADSPFNSKKVPLQM